MVFSHPSSPVSCLHIRLSLTARRSLSQYQYAYEHGAHALQRHAAPPPHEWRTHARRRARNAQGRPCRKTAGHQCSERDAVFQLRPPQRPTGYVRPGAHACAEGERCIPTHPHPLMDVGRPANKARERTASLSGLCLSTACSAPSPRTRGARDCWARTPATRRHAQAAGSQHLDAPPSIDRLGGRRSPRRWGSPRSSLTTHATEKPAHAVFCFLQEFFREKLTPPNLSA